MRRAIETPAAGAAAGRERGPVIETFTRRLGSLSHLSVGWRDVVDILVVAVLVYSLLRLIRGTRAVQMVLGIVGTFLLYEIAVFARLTAVRTVLQAVVFYLPLAIIVLFAQELRRALAAFGRNPLFAWFSGYHAEETISDIVLAATSLSARRVGALIVLERREGLKNYIENGVPVDSAVSYELLVTIFAPGTPLHDGAVIVSGGRVAAAGSFLPLSLRDGLSKRLGTRHRAAMGITEETDALAVVVSEERGTISVARDGELIEDLDGKALRDLLLREFSRGHKICRRRRSLLPQPRHEDPRDRDRDPRVVRLFGAEARAHLGAQLSDPLFPSPTFLPRRSSPRLFLRPSMFGCEEPSRRCVSSTPTGSRPSST